MKNLRIYLIIIAILAALAVYALLFKGKSTLGFRAQNIALSDTSGIDRIDIINNDTIQLTKTANGWQAEGYVVRPAAIYMTYQILCNLKINSTLDKHSSQIAREAIKTGACVRVYSGNKLKKSWRFTEDAVNKKNIAEIENSGKIYFVDVPGFNGRMLRVFNTSIHYWRDKRLTAYSPEQIASYSVQNNLKPTESFDFKSIGQNFEVKNASGNLKPLNYNQAGDFLTSLALVKFEGMVYHLSPDRRNWLKNRAADYIITIKGKDNKQIQARLYPIPLNNLTTTDLNKAWLFLGNDTLPVVIRYQDIDPILHNPL
jgi:hypothetical protein